MGEDAAVVLWIDRDECYPIYIAVPNSEAPHSERVEVAAATWARWQKAQDAFSVAQHEMEVASFQAREARRKRAGGGGDG